MDIKDSILFRFDFKTPGGAWLKSPNGEKQYFNLISINKAFGPGWFEEQNSKQNGLNCWIKIK